MISQNTIRQILDTCRIEEVVGWFVQLKKRGTSLIGLCPFHQEKTPSFNVSVTKGIYKCFGCGKGGDSVQFIMDHEKASYPEALRFLAEKYQIPIEENEGPNPYENDHRESLLILNQFAMETFQENLKLEEGKTIGYSYFLERGFRDDTIRKFELGYSFQSKISFAEKAIQYGFKSEYLIETGLCFETEQGSLMDRFRGRVMFPIHNLSGKVIAFGGRILKANEKTAKYLNSPESELYHKSDVLYGIFQAKKAIRDQDQCFLAEGYTDVISLSQSGIENVVASSGTSLTKAQIKLISRFTQNITILYDGDPAGIKASLRGIDLILEEGLHVKIVLFPDNQDPDSFIRKVGGKAFLEYIQNNQKDFIAFKTDLLLADAQGNPIKKAELIHDILESISMIPDSVLASIYTHECSEKLQMEERVLIAELNKVRIKKSKNQEKNEDFKRNEINAPMGQTPLGDQLNPIKESLGSLDFIPGDPILGQNPLKPVQLLKDDEQEEELLRLLLNYGGVEKEEGISVAEDIIIQIQDIEFENPLYSHIYQKITEIVQITKPFNPISLIQSRDGEIRNEVVKLLSQKYSLSENWKNRHGIEVKREEDLIAESVENCINHLKRRKLDHLIKENQDKMKLAKTPEEEAELLSIHLLYSNLRSNLSAALGVVVLK